MSGRRTRSSSLIRSSADRQLIRDAALNAEFKIPTALPLTRYRSRRNIAMDNRDDNDNATLANDGNPPQQRIADIDPVMEPQQLDDTQQLAQQQHDTDQPEQQQQLDAVQQTIDQLQQPQQLDAPGQPQQQQRQEQIFAQQQFQGQRLQQLQDNYAHDEQQRRNTQHIIPPQQQQAAIQRLRETQEAQRVALQIHQLQLQEQQAITRQHEQRNAQLAAENELLVALQLRLANETRLQREQLAIIERQQLAITTAAEAANVEAAAAEQRRRLALQDEQHALEQQQRNETERRTAHAAALQQYQQQQQQNQQLVAERQQLDTARQQAQAQADHLTQQRQQLQAEVTGLQLTVQQQQRLNEQQQQAARPQLQQMAIQASEQRQQQLYDELIARQATMMSSLAMVTSSVPVAPAAAAVPPYSVMPRPISSATSAPAAANTTAAIVHPFATPYDAIRATTNLTSPNLLATTSAFYSTITPSAYATMLPVNFNNPSVTAAAPAAISTAAVAPSVTTPLTLAPVVRYMQPASKSISLKPPEAYRGDHSQEAREWLNAVRNWLASQEAGPAEALRAFPVLLRETAAEWFEALTPATKCDWEALKAAFIERFKRSQYTQWTDTEDVFTCKQEPQQTVETFVSAMQKKLARLNNIPVQTQLHAIINGLRTDIKTHVIQHTCDSIEDIRKWATIAESATSSSSAANHDLAAALGSQATVIKSIAERLDMIVNQQQQQTLIAALPARLPQPALQQPVYLQTPTAPAYYTQPGPVFTTPAAAPSTTQNQGVSPNYRGRYPRPNFRHAAPNPTNFVAPHTGPPRVPATPDTHDYGSTVPVCNYCGFTVHRYNNCPAQNRVCGACGQVGHYQRMCTTVPYSSS